MLFLLIHLTQNPRLYSTNNLFFVTNNKPTNTTCKPYVILLIHWYFSQNHFPYYLVLPPIFINATQHQHFLKYMLADSDKHYS